MKEERLTKIERIRLSEQDVENLSKIKNKSKFMRAAIREKIERDHNNIIMAENRRKLKEGCPF